MIGKITSSSIQELIEGVQKKEQYLKSLGDNNFQGKKIISLMEAHKHSLQFYQRVFQQDSVRSKIFKTLIEKQKNHKESLLGLLYSNEDLFRQENKFILSHKSIFSQSLLLAIYLSKEFKNKIKLFTCDQSLKTLGHLISQENQVDRLGFVKDIAGKEGIIVHNITSWDEQISVDSEEILILDLFGLNPIEYRPFLFKFEQKMAKATKVFIYHSHLQDQEVMTQLQCLESNYFSEAIPIQLVSDHPVETIVENDERSMLDRLITFVREDSEKPEKQDVVIFIPADIHLRKFTQNIQEQFNRNQLKQAVNIITKPNESQSNTKNNIFLVHNVQQLIEWDYKLHSLFYAVDFEQESSFRFNYQIGAYVHHIGRCSGTEKARRMSSVGSNQIGRYASLSAEVGNNHHYIDQVLELSQYVLKMVVFGLTSKLEYEKKRLADCIQLMSFLQIVKRQEDSLQIIDQKIVEAVKAGVNPIEAKLVLDIMKDQKLENDLKLRLANLMAVAVVVSGSSQCLRKQLFGSELNYRKQGDTIWKKSNYLESCLELFTKCETIEFKSKAKTEEESEVEIIKRLSSRISDEETHFFGCLFALANDAPLPPKQVDIPTFIKHNEVNEQIFYDIRTKVEYLRQILEIKTVNIILEPQQIKSIYAQIVKRFPQTLAYYSGLKRIGYKFNNSNIVAKLGGNTLLAKSGEHPENLLVTNLTHKKSGYEIQECNSLSEDVLIEILGQLPVKKLESHGQAEIEFHGLSSATFEELFLNKNSLIAKFQEENDCTLDLKQEMDLIILHCERARADKIKQNLSAMLDKIKERIRNEKKLIHYLGKTSITMEIGGQVEDIIKDKNIDKCLLSNIDLEATKQDLEEIFQEFFVLKNLTLHPTPKGEQFQTATIQFFSQKDYYYFYQYYHGCEFYSRKFQVKPIHGPEHEDKPFGSQNYIIFKWFMWQSCGKALVKYAKIQNAEKAVQQLIKNSKYDGSEVTAKREQNQVIIGNLNPHTDEIYLRETMQGYGEVISVELLKYPLAEEAKPDVSIENLVRKVINNQNFKIEEIKRLPDGLRTCKVSFTNTNDIRKVVKDYNQKIGLMGQGRLYALSKFQKHILVPRGLEPIYRQIVYDYVNGARLSAKVYFQRYADSEYISIDGQDENLVQTIHRNILNNIRPQVFALNNKEKELVFNDLGLSSILFVEEKYSCKLVIDLAEKVISFISPHNLSKRIKEQIRDRLFSSFYYMLSLSSQTYKHICKNKDILEKLKEQHKLSHVELQIDSYAVLLSGSINKVEAAVAYMMHIAQSLVKKGDDIVSPDVCGICCEKFNRPYRLQQCSHMFCAPCLVEHYKTMLNNVSLFPAKCPQCGQLIVLRDLEINLARADWQKLKNIALNRFINTSKNKFKFCPTGGCKQINCTEGPVYTCDTCKIEYCNLCNETSHPGIRCEDVIEVRQSDEYFKKYMKEHGGRFCPNPSCKMPVIKIDGCNKVHCTRCDVSMCFKCPPDSMAYYEDQSECYEHLDNVHGGYY